MDEMDINFIRPEGLLQGTFGADCCFKAPLVPTIA